MLELSVTLWNGTAPPTTFSRENASSSTVLQNPAFMGLLSGVAGGMSQELVGEEVDDTRRRVSFSRPSDRTALMKADLAPLSWPDPQVGRRPNRDRGLLRVGSDVPAGSQFACSGNCVPFSAV